MFRVKTSGGRKLAARLRSDRRRDREVDGTVITIGFHDKRLAALAGLLEYGHPDTRLPERPAFRLTSRGDMLDRARAKLKEIGMRHDGPATAADLRELAIVLRDVLKAGYLSFHGPGLSERQDKAEKGNAGRGA